MAKLLANSTVDGKNIETVDGAQVKVDVAAQTIKADVSGLNREVAYLKLAQSAEERIEGGTVFADDYKGNRFGFALNESESQNVVIADGSATLQSLDVGELPLNNVPVSVLGLDNANRGGRKLVKTSNGTLYTGGINTANNTIQIFRSTDQGRTWNLFALISMSTSADFALATYGTDLYVAYFSSNSVLSFSAFSDAGSILKTAVPIHSSNSTPASVAMIVGDDGVIHVTHSAKVTSYTMSNNILYTTSTDGGASFGVSKYVNAVTNTSGRNYDYPNIILVDNIPVIHAVYTNTTNVAGELREFRLSGTTFTSTIILSITRSMRVPSAVVDQNKDIHVVVATTGTSGYGEGVYAYRKYGETQYSTYSVFPSSQRYNYSTGAMSVGKDGSIFIVYYGYEDLKLGVYYVKKVGASSFTAPVLITSNGHAMSVLYDSTFSTDMTFPPSVIAGSSLPLSYYSHTVETVLVPQTSGKLIYDVPATDYIGAFLKLGGALKASVYINNELAESTPVDGELRIVKEMAEAVPVKMRIELSRTDTTGGNNDNLTRILGGRA